MRSQFGLGALVLLDRKGAVVGGGAVSAEGKKYATVSPSLAARLRKPAVLAGKMSCGVLAASEAHYLYCAAPVVHTDGSGPTAGKLVALKRLDGTGAALLGRHAGLTMRVLQVPIHGATTTLNSALGPLAVQTRAVSDHKMDLLVGVPAVDGGAPLILQAAFARPVHVAATQSGITSAQRRTSTNRARCRA